jgi:hypothetical protein
VLFFYVMLTPPLDLIFRMAAFSSANPLNATTAGAAQQAYSQNRSPTPAPYFSSPQPTVNPTHQPSYMPQQQPSHQQQHSPYTTAPPPAAFHHETTPPAQYHHQTTGVPTNVPPATVPRPAGGIDATSIMEHLQKLTLQLAELQQTQLGPQTAPVATESSSSRTTPQENGKRGVRQSNVRHSYSNDKYKRGENHSDVKASRDEAAQWTRAGNNGNSLRVETVDSALSRDDTEEFVSPSAQSQSGTSFSTGTAHYTPTYHVVPENM